MSPPTAFRFAHLYRIDASLIAGRDQGPVDVWRDPDDDMLAPGELLHVAGSGLTLHGRFLPRGVAAQDTGPIGFVAADPQGAALLFAVTAVAPDSPVVLAVRSDGLFGFCAGTTIATTEGNRAVDILVPGDLILTDAGAVPLLRLGRRLACPLFADPLHSLPVRIEAGALGPGRPERALNVSPDLALRLGAILVQAGALDNGRTIWRVPAPRVIRYFQLILPVEALARAEGMEVETRCGSPRADVGADAPLSPLADLPRAASARQLPAGLRAALELGNAC